MSENQGIHQNHGNDEWNKAENPQNSRISAGDVARTAGGLAAEVGVGVAQMLLSVVILAVAVGLGLLIGFMVDGGTIYTIGIGTVVGGVLGLIVGMIINWKRGHSVVFF